MAQADISFVPEPGTKNYDAMTHAELKEEVYRQVREYREKTGRLPTQAALGGWFDRSREWGRDRLNEMRLSGLISEDGNDTVAELTAELERSEDALEQAINAQRAAESRAARIQEEATQAAVEVRAEAERRVAAVEGAMAERLKGVEKYSTAAAEQLHADHDRQIREIRAEAEAQVQRAQREASAAKADAERQLAGLEGASAERVRQREEQAAAELARIQADHEQQVKELEAEAEAQAQEALAEIARVEAEAERRVAEAIESAPAVRRTAEEEARAEVLAATVESAHHARLQGLMYGFYGVAAAVALTGQVWAGVEHIPFPAGLHVGWRIAIVAPAFAVIEFGGVVTAYAADVRRRLGERATGFRMMSFGAATVAAGFNLVGHWGDWFPAIGFTGLSVFAFVLWLLYSETRRRDVLRGAGMMSRPAPVYGVVQWWREPSVTFQARRLAVEHGYGMHESLRLVREENQAQAERTAVEEFEAKRRAGIAAAVERRIRELHKDDKIGADIAVTTIPLDKVADAVTDRVSVPDWADYIEHDIRPGARTAQHQPDDTA